MHALYVLRYHAQIWDKIVEHASDKIVRRRDIAIDMHR